MNRLNQSLIKRSYIIDTAVAVFFLSIIVFTYGGLFRTFFQQDEWAGYGQLLGLQSDWLLKGYSPFQTLAGVGRILGVPINYVLFSLKPFNVVPFTIFSLLFHSLNSYLVYRLAKKIFGSTWFGLLSGTFFAISFTHSEAVTWFAAVTTTLPSATCFLIALLLFVHTKDRAFYIRLVAIQFFLICSFLFKESVIPFLIAIPVYSGIKSGKKLFWRNIANYWLLILYTCYILGFRFFTIFSTKGSNSTLITASSNPLGQLIVHMMYYPLIGLSQIFIPSVIMFKLSAIIFQTQYKFLLGNAMSDAIIHIVITDLLSVFFSMLIISSVLFIYLNSKKYRQLILISLGLYFLSYFPFAILNRPMSSYLESRYYYLPTIAASLLLIIVVSFLCQIFKRTRFSVLPTILVVLVISGYFIKNIQFIKRDISSQIISANERKSLLFSFKQLRPVLPKNPIIYVSGDSPGFYGLANVVLPLQQGPGYTLMVWYANSGTMPLPLLREFYLWNIYDQGYRQVDGKGFGYFWDKNTLLSFYKSNSNISLDQLVGFYYIGSQKKLVDITADTRKEIQQQLVLSKK